MIIVQTPLRISFLGGATDFPGFYHEHGGCVLSTAIDKYIFVTIKERFDSKIRVGYTKTEMVDTVDEIQHELIREAMRKTDIQNGIEITTIGDIPDTGSGLGSSSTVTVGALHAMYALRSKLVTEEQLAQEACDLERVTLGKPIGIQDQYIAAYGGFRFIEFKTNGDVVVNSVELSKDCERHLNNSLLLFYTGVTRKADTILTEQKQNIVDRSSILCEMRDMAYEARDEIEKENIDALGYLLHESWQLKKQLASKVSNGLLNDMYETAIKAGAVGGKIAGAGGGGFLLLYCPYERHAQVRAALSHLQEFTFKVRQDGTKVIFNYHR